MSTWQIILLVIFIFLVSLCFSFSSKPSKKRTVMRFVSVLLLVVIVAFGYMLSSMIKEAKKCPNSGKYFYENKGELCYATSSMNTWLKSNDITINKFVIIDNENAVFNTSDNSQYELKYRDGEGVKLRHLN